MTLRSINSLSYILFIIICQNVIATRCPDRNDYISISEEVVLNYSDMFHPAQLVCVPILQSEISLCRVTLRSKSAH